MRSVARKSVKPLAAHPRRGPRLWAKARHRTITGPTMITAAARGSHDPGPRATGDPRRTPSNVLGHPFSASRHWSRCRRGTRDEHGRLERLVDADTGVGACRD